MTTSTTNSCMYLHFFHMLQSIVWIFTVAGLLANFISAAVHAVMLYAANLGVV